jgi:signal transduction histidine kinase
MSSSPARRRTRLGFLSGPSQRLIGVFVLFIALPGAFLGAFAFRALRQEGQISRQRTRESLERDGDEIGRFLDAEFRRWDDAASSNGAERSFGPDSLPETIIQAFAEPGGGVFVSVSEKGLEAYPPGALLFRPSGLPARPGPPIPRSARLARAEALEISSRDYGAALLTYRALFGSSGEALRPVVLQRLARTLRKAGRLDEAASAYRDLLELETTWIGDMPSDLIARTELCSLASERGDSDALAAQSLTLYGDLARGRWLLDKPRYLYYSDLCRGWCRESPATTGDSSGLRTVETRKLALSGAVEEFLNNPDRMISSDGTFYVAFHKAGKPNAIVMSAAFLSSRWWPRVLQARGEDLAAALCTVDGEAIFGSPPAEAPPFSVTRNVRVDDAPWLLQVWPARPEAIAADIRQRQALSLAMLGFVALLLAFGSYLTVRIVRREVEIARLRADFVSTVSHEFRSPLTGIRQLGEMLLDSRVADAEKQRDYYRMIVQESARLTRLVENILDFSRMEEGRREYRFETMSPGPWLRKLAADFAAEIGVNGVAVEANIPDGLPVISADGQALGSAVRNLLDNAVKYSPGEPKIWLEAEAEAGGLKISVRDRGIGISETDRKRVFDRFFRAGGEVSKRVKGAGLGLSLVKHIVSAHGGTVACESRLGEGSVFTITIPGAGAGG